MTRYTFEIDNFQSIQHLKLEFSKFTALIGPTNRGKSAIIRALDAILHNNFHPVFVREGADQCTLALTLHDHPVIRKITFIRNPKKQVNTYKILKADGTTEEFPKSGTTTPATIQDAGIRTLDTDRGQFINTNIHTQHEPLFVLMSTETQVTDIFNALFQTNRIEAALMQANRDNLAANKEHTDTVAAIDKAKTNLATRGEEAKQAEARLVYLSGVRRAYDAAAKAAETTERRHMAYLELRDSHRSKTNKLQETRVKHQSLGRAADRLTTAHTADALHSRSDISIKVLDTTTNLMNQAAKRVSAIVSTADDILAYQHASQVALRATQLKAPTPPPHAAERTRLIDMLSNTLTLTNNIKHYNDKCSSIKVFINAQRTDIADSHANIARLDEYRKTQIDSLICPTCGRPLQADHVHAVAARS